MTTQRMHRFVQICRMFTPDRKSIRFGFSRMGRCQPPLGAHSSRGIHAFKRFYDYFAQLMDHCKRATIEEHIKLRLNRMLSVVREIQQVENDAVSLKPEVKTTRSFCGLQHPFLIRTHLALLSPASASQFARYIHNESYVVF